MTFLGEAAGRAIGEGVKRRNHRGTRGNTKATTNEQTMKATTKKQTTKDAKVARRFYLKILRDSLVSFVVILFCGSLRSRVSLCGLRFAAEQPLIHELAPKLLK